MPTVTPTLHPKIKAAAVKVIAGLGLVTDRGTPLEVRSELFPDATNEVLPCIRLTIEDGQEEIIGGTTRHWVTWYSVKCLFVDRASPKQHENEPLYLNWRRAIWEAFHMKRPLGGADSDLKEVWSDLRPLAPFSPPDMKEYQKVAGGLILRFLVKELRT